MTAARFRREIRVRGRNFPPAFCSQDAGVPRVSSPPIPKSHSPASPRTASWAERPYAENTPTTTGDRPEPDPVELAGGLHRKRAGASGAWEGFSPHKPGLQTETHQPLSPPCRGGRSPPDSELGARGTVSGKGRTAPTPNRAEGKERGVREGGTVKRLLAADWSSEHFLSPRAPRRRFRGLRYYSPRTRSS